MTPFRSDLTDYVQFLEEQTVTLGDGATQLSILGKGTIMQWVETTPHCQSHSTLQLPTCYERLLALSNPCWTLPVGCSLVHRGRIESTINLYPTKGKAMAMSAATTSLEWPD